MIRCKSKHQKLTILLLFVCCCSVTISAGGEFSLEEKPHSEIRNSEVENGLEVETNNKNSEEGIHYLAREAWVNAHLSEMTLNQKLGQFFMVDLWPMEGEASIENAIATIEKHHIGNIIVFKSHPHQVLDVINRSQEAASIPLLVAIDGEWGVDMRLDSVIEWPYQLALGSATDFDPLYQMGKAVAKECLRLGIHINFAPVVDVNSNPNNPVIGYRSFGENPSRVGQAGSVYMRGMQDHGVIAVAKHFPGHGDTDSDSHKTLPSVFIRFKGLAS